MPAHYVYWKLSWFSLFYWIRAWFIVGLIHEDDVYVLESVANLMQMSLWWNARVSNDGNGSFDIDCVITVMDCVVTLARLTRIPLPLSMQTGNWSRTEIVNAQVTVLLQFENLNMSLIQRQGWVCLGVLLCGMNWMMHLTHVNRAEGCLCHIGKGCYNTIALSQQNTWTISSWKVIPVLRCSSKSLKNQKYSYKIKNLVAMSHRQVMPYM